MKDNLQTFSSNSVASYSPLQLLSRFWRHRYLVRQLTWKTLMGSYGGTFGGILWVVAKPLLMLSIYAFVFGFVFNSRFYKSGADRDQMEFTLALFVGLSIFTVFSEMVSKAPNLIVANSNFVKKVVFPLDMFIIAELGSSLFVYLISTAILFPVLYIHYGTVALASISLPIVVIPFFMLTAGISWMLAALGVYLRDISQLTPMIISILMFLSPIFFPTAALPDSIRPFIWLSPVTYAVETSRDCIFQNHFPDLVSILIQYAMSATIMWIGWLFFQRTQKGFADVL